MRFASLQLENWRNFTRASVPLGARVFLVGPNAAGKSNFLDVFRFLHDLVAFGFDRAVDERRGGVSKLRSLAARRYPEIAIKVEIQNGASGGDLWSYELRFKQDNQGRPTLTRERVERGSRTLLSRPDRDDVADRERLRQTHLEQVNANREFREVAAFFSSIRYLHLVPQLVREPDRSVGRIRDPFGGDFLEQVATTTAKTRTARLRRLSQALRVAVPQAQGLGTRPRSKGRRPPSFSL